MAELPALTPFLERLLLEQGSCDSLELLRLAGWLTPEGERAWRAGLAASLEDVLVGDLAAVLSGLEDAGRWARSLGLVLDSSRRDGDDDLPPFTRLPSRRAEALFRSRHVRPARFPGQLNLFLDGSSTARGNDLIAALVEGDWSRAREFLDQLRQSTSDQGWLAPYARLIQAVTREDFRLSDPAVSLERLESEIVPLAVDVLKDAAARFLRPFWTSLDRQLVGMGYDPARPNLHRSHTLARLEEWAEVEESILHESTWRQDPILLWRLAEARYRHGGRRDRYSPWLLMCWDFPGAAERALDSVRLFDGQLRQEWLTFLDLEPELSVECFPAWLLFSHPDLAGLPEAVDARSATGGRRWFGLVAALLAPTGAHRRWEETLIWRRELRNAHAGLFSICLKRIASRNASPVCQ